MCRDFRELERKGGWTQRARRAVDKHPGASQSSGRDAERVHRAQGYLDARAVNDKRGKRVWRRIKPATPGNPRFLVYNRTGQRVRVAIPPKG